MAVVALLQFFLLSLLGLGLIPASLQAPENGRCNPDVVFIIKNKTDEFDFESECGKLQPCREIGQNDIILALIQQNGKLAAQLASERHQDRINSEKSECREEINEVTKDLAALRAVKEVDWVSLLRKAAANGNTRLVSALLKIGTEPSAPDAKGITPLHEAARNGNLEAARLLLDAGANVEANDVEKQAPLNFASMTSNAALVNLLLDRGAYIDHPDVHLRTPLLWSTWHGSLPATQVLLKRGANTAAVNTGGRNPLQEAKFYKHADVAAWVEKWLSTHK
ncbi:CARD- and ANK-domain containing inflammasome adapter protein-like [Periplaneta americana]|uniref:CARD- and ANK-domain containing inflammasome adapter protein-like n=1 Tax=Periplaneta americana TaxID=6978 RepID=UPI0037E9ACF9